MRSDPIDLLVAFLWSVFAVPVGLVVFAGSLVVGGFVLDYYDHPRNFSRDGEKFEAYISTLVQPGQPSSEAVSSLENLGLQCEQLDRLYELQSRGLHCWLVYSAVVTRGAWSVELAVEGDLIRRTAARYALLPGTLP